MWRSAWGWVGTGERRSRTRRTSRAVMSRPRRLMNSEPCGVDPFIERRPPGGDIAADRLGSRMAHRHAALLASLSPDGHGPALQIDVAQGEPAELRDS